MPPRTSPFDIDIREIKTQQEYQAVLAAGKEDCDGYPIFPTHVVLKNGKIAGAFCTWSPTVYWWMHSKLIKTLDSFAIFQTLDTLMNVRGTPTYVMPCEPESPYYKMLSNKLDHLPSVGGNDFRIFINTKGDKWEEQ
jgi:hypothetical protein